MGVQVAFNYANWVALFPVFSPSGGLPVSEQNANVYFQLACMIHANDGSGPVNSPGIQINLLNLLTAHFAQLMTTPAGAAQVTPLVGRISQAAEGSVSVTTELPTNMPMASGFFTQTQYGYMYWTASAPFRRFIYAPNNRNPVNAGLGFNGGGYLGGDPDGYNG
jgi:hypothetical protein